MSAALTPTGRLPRRRCRTCNWWAYWSQEAQAWVCTGEEPHENRVEDRRSWEPKSKYAAPVETPLQPCGTFHA